MDIFYYYFDKLISNNFLNPFNFVSAFLYDYKISNGVFYYLNLIFYFLLYAFSYFIFKSKNYRFLNVGFLKGIFPKEIYKSNSFKIDMYWNVIAILKIHLLFIRPLSIIFLVAFFKPFFDVINIYNIELFYNLRQKLDNVNTGIIPLFSFFLIILAGDFAIYFAHRLSHSSKLLWCFHRVHHYPSQISLFAANRQHPFETFVWETIKISFVAVCCSILLPFEGSPFDIKDTGIKNELLIFFFVTFPMIYAPFIHLHFPISFGKYLNKIFVSPCVHSLHHASAIKNINFGSIFSFWDVFFGTYHPFDSSESSALLNSVGTDGNHPFLHGLEK